MLMYLKMARILRKDAGCNSIRLLANNLSLYLDIPNKKIFGTNVFSQDTTLKTQELKISWNAALSDIYKDYKGEENPKYWGNELKLGK